MRTRAASVAVLLTSILPAMGAAAAPPVGGGTFTDGKVTLDWAPAGGGLRGTIALGADRFPLTAKANGGSVEGTFDANGGSFPFTAASDGDAVTLVTGGRTYRLTRVPAAPANPLGRAGSAGGVPAAPAAAGDAPDGYAVVAASDAGKSFAAEKRDASSVQSALEAGVADLGRYLGARPVVGRAFRDAKDPHAGQATFTANWQGRPVAGTISCKLHDGGGATVAIVLARADATRAQWDALTSPPASSAAADLLGPDAQVYAFPDGTGTVTVPHGWTAAGQSLLSPVFIKGPADQTVVLGNTFAVSTPDSQLVQMIRQNQAMARQMGIPPSAPPPILIAPFTDPVQATIDLAPQLSRLNQAQGSFAVEVGKVEKANDLPCNLPGGKAALLDATLTRTQQGRSTPFREREAFIMAPTGNGAWFATVTGYTAPAATYDRDRPLMEAVLNSVKPDEPMIARRSQERQAQMQQQLQAQLRQGQGDQDARFRAQQQQHADQMAAFDAHNRAWAAGEVDKSRANADFIETIRGTRTVYDTRTGDAGTADLTSAGGVVDSLNTAANDPGRFVQIPLRDELYPTTPAGR